MPVDRELNEALAEAARLFIELRLSLGVGDPALGDLKGPRIVAELQIVARDHPQLSQRALVIINMIAKAALTDDQMLNLHAAD